MILGTKLIGQSGYIFLISYNWYNFQVIEVKSSFRKSHNIWSAYAIWGIKYWIYLDLIIVEDDWIMIWQKL